MAGQSWWGATQWAAYLEHQEQPIKAASKVALRAMEERAGDSLSGHAYAALMLDDPMLALRLIKEANKRLPRRMARDITTPLGVVMALGTTALREQIETAPEISEENTGFMACEARASLAARIAFAWAHCITTWIRANWRWPPCWPMPEKWSCGHSFPSCRKRRWTNCTAAAHRAAKRHNGKPAVSRFSTSPCC